MSSPQRTTVWWICVSILIVFLVIGLDFGKGFYIGLSCGVAWAILAAVGHDLTK